MAALEVLHCSACGAPVALGEADEAACGQCGARTPIPAEHRALRDASGWDAEARRAAEAALHTFDRPPGLFMRVVAWFAGWSLIGLLVLFGLPLLMIDLILAVRLTNLICRALGWPYGNMDVVPVELLASMMGVALWLMTVVPAFLAVYGRRRVTSRGLLVAALAAKPPAYPGGPARCRACGAPLTVAADAAVARCLYCRAENAVRLTDAQIGKARASTGKIVDTMQQAAERDRREREETRGKIRSRVLTATWKVAVMTVLWVVAMHDMSKPQGEASGVGVAAAVGITLFLIYLLLASVASVNEGSE